MNTGIDPSILKEICKAKMPFGEYKGHILADLPISYLEWFLRNGGFPKGRLGMQLATVYEILRVFFAAEGAQGFAHGTFALATS